MNKKLNLAVSTLAIISFVVFIIVNVGNSYYSAHETVVSQNAANWTLFSSIYSVLIMAIPTIEFVIKAYNKHYNKQVYNISTLSKVLTVLSFGMPVLAYAFTSLTAKVMFDSEEETDIEGWGYVILSIITLGTVWIAFLLAVGPAVYVYKRALKGVFEVKGESVIIGVSLVIVSVVTLGIVWIGILIGIASTRLLILQARRTTLGIDYELETYVKVTLIVFTVISLGLFAVGLFSTYWQYEVFFLNSEKEGNPEFA